MFIIDLIETAYDRVGLKLLIVSFFVSGALLAVFADWMAFGFIKPEVMGVQTGIIVTALTFLILYLHRRSRRKRSEETL